MSVCYSKNYKSDLPLEERLLKDVSVRLIEPSERKRHDELMEGEHYLGNANAVGQVLRYVAEYNGEWISALQNVETPESRTLFAISDWFNDAKKR